MNPQPYWLSTTTASSSASPHLTVPPIDQSNLEGVIPISTTTMAAATTESGRLRTLFHLHSAQSEPLLRLSLSDHDIRGRRLNTGPDIAQLPGRSTFSRTTDYSHMLLDSIKFNNANSAFSLPFLALPPFRSPYPDIPLRQPNKCAVCDEPATGRHYGAASCFGCKSFWRRSIITQRKYRCKANGKCWLKKVPHQNLCRACRFRKCVEVGMNPQAIQLEQDQSFDLSTLLSKSETSESKQFSPTPSTSSDHSSHLSHRNQKIKQLARHHELILSRVDGPLEDGMEISSTEIPNTELVDGCATPQDVPIKAVPYEEAFFNPSLIYPRTKLNPEGFRPATAQDIINDSKRCFVLYSDWLLALDEFKEFCKEDQICLSKNRFAIFHWWICSIWTIDANKNVLCYSNGAYFSPDSSSPQPSNNIISKIFIIFIQPLKDLDLDTEKRCLFFLIAFFRPEEPRLSSDGKEKLQKFYDFYVRLLYNITMDEARNSSTEGTLELEFKAAKRYADIMALVNTLYTYISLTLTNEGAVPDILHIVN